MAQILADSINNFDQRITTIYVEDFPYCLLQEINTHRTLSQTQVGDSFNHFSRNATSTRALKSLIERCEEDFFIPHWEAEQKGMSGLDSFSTDEWEDLSVEWARDLEIILQMAKKYRDRGVHKGKYNRLLAAFLKVPVVITGTSTYWHNFFSLRCNEQADSDFRDVAIEIFNLYKNNRPQLLNRGFLHLPTFDSSIVNERWQGLTLEIKETVVRIARTSFDRANDEMESDYIEDFFARLVRSKHWSPLEHIAICADGAKYRNYDGWMSLRQIVELGLVVIMKL